MGSERNFFWGVAMPIPKNEYCAVGLALFLQPLVYIFPKLFGFKPFFGRFLGWQAFFQFRKQRSYFALPLFGSGGPYARNCIVADYFAQICRKIFGVFGRNVLPSGKECIAYAFFGIAAIPQKAQRNRAAEPAVFGAQLLYGFFISVVEHFDYKLVFHLSTPL